MPELGMFEVEQESDAADWVIRVGIAVMFFIAGAEKFQANTSWIKMFQQIGWGDWFRYFTGVVEIGGALLTLVPKTAILGIALLAVTMAAATVIHAAILRDGAVAIFPGILTIGLTAFAVLRRMM